MRKSEKMGDGIKSFETIFSKIFQIFVFLELGQINGRLKSDSTKL